MELFFLIFIGLQVGYFLLFALASVFPFRPPISNSTSSLTFGILIPAYREDSIIRQTVQNLKEQNYPTERYKVVVMADHLQADTVNELRKAGATVLEVRFSNSTKAKSLYEGLKYLKENTTPDIVLILDADNHLEKEGLQKFCRCHNSSQKVWQTHRMAKNKNTGMAVLDAVNEEIGNSIFRKGHRRLGLSSALTGSGMFFDFYYLYELFGTIDCNTSAEDKLLEFKILEENTRVEYLPHIAVKDEKVAKVANYGKQRTRWFGGQFYFLQKHFVRGWGQLLKGNVNYFDKMLQMALIPKVLLIGLTIIMAVVSLIFGMSYWWVIIMGAYALALAIAIPGNMYNYQLLRAVGTLPAALFFTVLSILRIKKKSHQTFETTQKDYVDS